MSPATKWPARGTRQASNNADQSGPPRRNAEGNRGAARLVCLPARPVPRRAVGWLIASVLVVLMATWVVWGSPLLNARSVAVDGVSGQQRRDVEGLVQPQLAKPLAQVDVAAVEEAIRSSGRYSAVSVSRSWPSTISVSVRPRVPVLAVRDDQGQYRVVDAEGVVYATAAKPPDGVPQAVLPTPAHAQVVQAAASIIAHLPPDQRNQISALDAANVNRMVVRVGSTDLVWGDATNTELKASIWAHLRQHGPYRVVDLSTPEAPTTR